MEVDKNTILDWLNDLKIENRKIKEELALIIALKVKKNETIGFGSGTTSMLIAKEIGKKVKKENLKIYAVVTSREVQYICEYYDIKVIQLKDANIDWCFDGADEVDKNNWLIKGKGGALYKEKLNIKASNTNYIVVDESKLVNYLGEKCLVPVEFSKEKLKTVENELRKIGAKYCELRKNKTPNDIYITENGNYIYDVKFEKIDSSMEERINSINGVVENGLFIGYNIEIIKLREV